MKVLSFGEILWDIIEGKKYLGGAPFNFSAHISQCGAEAFIVSRLGKDTLGKKAHQEVIKWKVDPSFIQWDETYPTGTVDVSLQEGQPTYRINTQVAYDFIAAEELHEKIKIHDFDIFYFGTLAQRNPVSARALQKIMQDYTFKHVFCDLNLREGHYTKETIENSLKLCSILKLNHEEVQVLSSLFYREPLSEQLFAQKIAQDYHQKIIIITAGAEGCYVYYQGELHKIGAQKVKVKDAVGAGDSFSAAFLFKYLRNADPVEAGKAANRVGGFVASSRGAIPSYSNEIRELLGISKTHER